MIPHHLKLIALLGLMASTTIADLEVGCYSSVSGTKNGSYKYQTPSYCVEQCPDSPYVALTGGDTCYCLSSKPSDDDLTDSSDCDTPCYGYGSENCGGSGTYSVFVGTGTESDDDSSVASSSTSTSTALSTSSADASTSADDSTTDSSSTTDAPSSSSTATKIVTTSSNSQGSQIVKTVTRDASTTSSLSSSTDDAKTTDDNDDDDNKSHKTSKIGPIVGGVVGGVAALVILLIITFFLIKRRREQEEEDDEEEYFDKPAGGSINRKYGTGKSKKSLKSNALDMPMTNPFTHPSDNLHDRQEMVDPRLNPVMLGRRRLSEGSLADETDYSRKILQVANPDSN